MSGPPDVPEGELKIEILFNQLFATFVSKTPVANIFTLRNLVDRAVRAIIDAAGYVYGHAYDVDIVQLVRTDNDEKHVFGVNIPALSGICEQEGISVLDVLRLTATEYFFDHALADLREAIKAPRDTGFFCYRAIESLKNLCTARHDLVAREKAEWDFFRSRYGIEQADLLSIKAFADPIRHGRYVRAKLMSDSERAEVFKKTWTIFNKFILLEKAELPDTASSSIDLKESRKEDNGDDDADQAP
jgi:hypothetical protein